MPSVVSVAGVRTRTALAFGGLAAALAGQLLFDAKAHFAVALALFFGGLAVFGAAAAAPLRTLVPPASPDASERDPLADGAAAPSPLARRWEIAAFAAVMAIGAFFRLFRLDAIPPGLNHDTAFLAIYPIELLRGAAPLTPYFVTPSHYPIGYETFQPLVTAMFMSVMGTTPLAAKLSTAASSLAALVLVYFLVRYLFGARTALLTSFLASVCAWHFIFARVGWHCIAVPLWETAAVFLLLAAIRTRRRALYLLAGAATAVNLATYSISRLLAAKEAALVVYLRARGVIRRATHGRGLLLAAVVFVACSTPVILYAARNWSVFQGRARDLIVSRKVGQMGAAPLVANLQKTILNMNYRANGDDFFINEPLLDFPISLLFAVGFVICCALADRPRYGLLLLWFVTSMAPGVLSAPNPNHNMGALVPALILAGVAAEFGVRLARREAARRGRAFARAAAATGLAAAGLVVCSDVRTYLDPRTRREMWGFYPETRVVGEYMRAIQDTHEVYVADNFPEDTLTFLTYRGGPFAASYHYLWTEGASMLTRPLKPPDGKGVAFIASPVPANDRIFRGLLQRFPGARLVPLNETIDPRHADTVVAKAVLIEPPSLAAEVPLARAPTVAACDGPSAFVGGFGADPGFFDQAMGVATGPSGVTYVADMHNHRVQKLGADGRPVMTIGRQGSGDGEFNEPRDVTVDASGNLYVVDTWNTRVQEFDPRGTLLRSFRTSRGLFGPKGAAVDGDRLLVTDTGNGTVEVFDLGGRQLATWGGPGEGPGQFREPVGIAADGRGHVFVADTGNGRIQKLDRDGRFLLAWPVASWDDRRLHEAYLACGPAAGVFVADPASGRVLHYSEDGRPLADAAAGLGAPTGLAFRGADELVVSERAANRLVVVRVAAEASAPLRSP